MYKIKLNKVILKKVFLVFIVGLVSRSAINIVLAINVGMDYSNYISMAYYLFMFCVSAVVCEIPGVNLSIFNIRLIKDAIISYLENRDVFEEKMGCDVDGLKRNSSRSNGRISDDYLSHSQNSSGERGHGTKKVSAGLSGLYGNSNNSVRVRRPSAGLIGLYGDRDESTQTSSRSSHSSRSTREIESNRDRRRYDTAPVDRRDVRDESTQTPSRSTREIESNRDRRRYDTAPVDRRDVRVVREPTVNRVGDLGFSKERVSGFKPTDTTVLREDFYYIVPENKDFRDIEKFVSVDPNAGFAPRGYTVNPDYVPSEIAISLRSTSEYGSSISSGTTESLVRPRAPRPGNLSTPETMSPLFPPSETSSRRSYSIQRDIRSRHWDSFYSRSPYPVSSVASYDTDLRNVELIQNKLREAKRIISDSFSQESAKVKASSKGKSFFTRRK